MYQSTHRTLWSYFSIIHQLRSPYKCVASSHSASSLPNITVRFPCQLFPRLFRCTSMEAAEVCHRWRCRRREEFCVWRDAQRKKRVGCRDVYKEELTVLRVHSSLRLSYSMISQPMVKNRIFQIISSSRTFRTDYWTAHPHCILFYFLYFLHHLYKSCADSR